AEVVLNEKPAFAGRVNVNLQAASARAGIERVVALGCRYVAKTRTDQRVYCLPLLLSLPRYLDYFPLRNAPGQRKRLVATSWGSSVFCPYHMADQLMFGTGEDMLAYWSPPCDETNESRDNLMAARERETSVQAASTYAPEHYLIYEYLKRDGAPLP